MLRGSCRLLALPLALALVGCGAGLEPTTTELTEAEASELSEVVLFATFNSTSVLPPRPAGSPGAGWGMDFEAEVRCPAGGKVVMAASLTVVEPDDRAVYELIQVHDDCTAQPTERRFSVAGAPRVTSDLVVQHGRDGAETWSGSTQGDVEWRTSDGVGRCDFRLDFRGERRPELAATAALSGTMCGHAVDHFMTIS